MLTTRRAILACAPAALLPALAAAAPTTPSPRLSLFGGPLDGRHHDSTSDITRETEPGPRAALSVYAGDVWVGQYTEMGTVQFRHEKGERRMFIWTQSARYDAAKHWSGVVRVVRVVAKDHV